MVAELLNALTADASRLLAAGAPAATGDDRLAQRAAALRPLAARVPALGVLTEAIERVTASVPEQAVRPLLDLLARARQACAGVATAGLAGELSPPPPPGPWATPLPTRELFGLIDLSPTGLVWRGKPDQVKDLARTGAGADLRLLDAWLLLLEQQAAGVAAVPVHEILRAYGRSVLSEVRHLRERDESAVLLAYRLDRATGLAWADDFLKMATGVTQLVPQFGPGAVRAWLDALDRRTREEGQFPTSAVAAADALREVGRPAVNRLLAMLNDENPSARRAAVVALGLMGPTAKGAVPALVLLLHADDSDLRAEAFRALGGLGPAAEPALPALQEIARDFRDRLWQEKALATMQQIRNALRDD